MWYCIGLRTVTDRLDRGILVAARTPVNAARRRVCALLTVAHFISIIFLYYNTDCAWSELELAVLSSPTLVVKGTPVSMQVEWDNEEKTILHIEFIAQWTWEEAYTTFDQVVQMM